MDCGNKASFVGDVQCDASDEETDGTLARVSLDETVRDEKRVLNEVKL